MFKKSLRIDKSRKGSDRKMKTYELLKMLDEISRLRLLLNMSLAEVLNVCKEVDIDTYHGSFRNK